MYSIKHFLINVSVFIKVSVPIQNSERRCIGVLGPSIFNCFYDSSVGFWNCSDSSTCGFFYVLHFIRYTWKTCGFLRVLQFLNQSKPSASIYLNNIKFLHSIIPKGISHSNVTYAVSCLTYRYNSLRNEALSHKAVRLYIS